MKPPAEINDYSEEAIQRLESSVWIYVFIDSSSISDIINGLKEDGIEPRILLNKLEQIKAILMIQREEQKKAQAQNDVPTVTISAPEMGEEIGADVAEWLTSTFTKPPEVEMI